eukprot:4154420-Amphidinium_carterae.1
MGVHQMLRVALYILVSMKAPADLAYPSVSDVHTVGEDNHIVMNRGPFNALVGHCKGRGVQTRTGWRCSPMACRTSSASWFGVRCCHREEMMCSAVSVTQSSVASRIFGVPTGTVAQATYTITASNQARSCNSYQ